MRFSVDSNLLIYSIDTGTPTKHLVARDVMVRALHADAVLTAQAIAEYLKIVRQKLRPGLPAALLQAQRWTTLLSIVPTTLDLPFKALAFAERYNLQFWDALICQGALAGGAGVLLSEDMQDGLMADGLTILDPFNPANHDRLDELLTPSR